MQRAQVTHTHTYVRSCHCMNIPGQIHFDALGPDDFEFKKWLVTAESENLWEVWALIAQKLKEKRVSL